MASAQKDADAEAAFVAWLQEGGATFPKLEWPVYEWPGQPHDGERGVRCTQDIAVRAVRQWLALVGATHRSTNYYNC